MARSLDLCAIDAGQTDTRYLVLDRNREVLSGSTGKGVTNILLLGAKSSLVGNLGIIVQQIRKRLGARRLRTVTVAFTGVSREREEYGVVLAVLKSVFPGARVILESDIVACHAANFQDRPGIILHAGTGAFAYGVDRQGKRLRVGGWGYLLGDEGAGFGLGLEAVRAAIRAWERTGPQTSLKEVLLPFFDLAELSQLKSVVYSAAFRRQQIADFARLLLQYAEAGDEVADLIVAAGVERMVALVAPLLEELQFDRPEVALAGSLYCGARSYFERSKAGLQEKYGQGLEVRLGDRSPLEGALWIAARAAEVSS